MPFFDYWRKNPRLTRSALAEKTALSENGVKKIIANLKSQGWIERRGSNRNGYLAVLRQPEE